MIVYHRHARSIGLCNQGLRKWFVAHNLDWADFLENGLDADYLSSLDDHVAQQVVQKAKDEANEIVKLDIAVKRGGCV